MHVARRRKLRPAVKTCPLESLPNVIGELGPKSHDGMTPVWMREEMKGTKLTKDSFLIK